MSELIRDDDDDDEARLKFKNNKRKGWIVHSLTLKKNFYEKIKLHRFSYNFSKKKKTTMLCRTQVTPKQ